MSTRNSCQSSRRGRRRLGPITLKRAVTHYLERPKPQKYRRKEVPINNPIPHPQGEPETTALVPHAGPVAVDTFGGRAQVEWDAQAAVTPLGQLPLFNEFLRLGGRFDAWVESCTLNLTSPNAPSARHVLGTCA